MPLVQINMLEGRTPEQKEALLRAVTEAVQTTLGSPLASIRVWINDMPRTNYMAAGQMGPPPAG